MTIARLTVFYIHSTNAGTVAAETVAAETVAVETVRTKIFAATVQKQ